ncbi:hypothetical protein BJ912DRAFT_981967 [Pholiota molesta]|nr:hypothetical protein BJ912DRAFT_981967 [Pholiota molesta]
MPPPGQPQGSYSPQMANMGIATEVRYLLQEIGKLRDERRQLQAEISELMSVRSKFSPNGEFQPEWRLPVPAIEAPLPELPPAPEEPVPQAKPGWRVVHKRPERKARTAPKAITGPPPPAPPPMPEPPKPEAPAWTQWRRMFDSILYLMRPLTSLLSEPPLAPTSMAPSPTPMSPPPRGGLFGRDDS